MLNLASFTFRHSEHPNISPLYQDFTLELNSNLLLQIMSSYQLKAAHVTGSYTFNTHHFEQLVTASPFNLSFSSLENSLHSISQWPAQLNWAQYSRQINHFLLAWLIDYKSGASLDSAFLLASCLELHTAKNTKFQKLLMHLIARVTNQLEQYKFDYIQHFDLETGLPNQQLLINILKQRLDINTENAASNVENLGLILINLNVNFDKISRQNATASQVVLAAVNAIQQHLNEDTTIFHIGVAELAIMIEPLNSPAQLNLIAARLIHAFESAMPLENITLILTPYFGGISTFKTPANAISLYENAKLALHHALIKNIRFKIYNQHIASSFTSIHLLDEAIIEALQQNELAVYLQPIISLAGRPGEKDVCSSAEVLLRWPNQEWQAVSPTRLIDTIYKKGFGKVFIRWLINNACQRCAELMSQYQRNITLTVNLCSMDLFDEDLAALLTQSITLWEIPAENLTIEITETDTLVDEEKSAKVIAAIVALGCKLALDDFGTGYSSMTRLLKMPIHLVKIDQSFVRNMLTSNEDKAVVQSVVKLAHSLGKQVVAEGVEDLASLNILKKLQCDKIQGHYYAKPMPFDEFVTWLNLFESGHQAAVELKS
ncbi:MAG: GGDEF domain-containing protein [Betaproteobacteria bacterium HGW-Betaproteobacteria-20]|nr:MAG: GGDEF domain-containing protein [Betaproteobacteria bacterium HGW-Betaproteobacteria-20]